MKSVGLTTYSFCVRNSDNIEFELHDIFGDSFIGIINNSAGVSLNEYDNDEDGESVFTFEQVVFNTIKNEDNQDMYDVLALRVKTGEYGTESEIVDSETGIVNYTRSQNEADVMPFGCCIMVPSGEHTKGVFVFQSIGRYGIVTVMKKYIDGYLKHVNSNLRFVMEPVMPRQCASRMFEQGILKSVRFIRYQIPEDDAERYGLDRNVKEVVEERVIRRPAGFLRNKTTEIQEFFNRERNIDEIVRIEDFRVDDLKFEFQNGKRIKTISLKNIDNVIISEDITEEVVLDNGHPNFESLCHSMRETGEYYLRARGAII